MSVYLSVVIPAYNEEKNIKAGSLEQVRKFLSCQKYTWEVLVVNDESTDKTARLVADYANKYKGFRLLMEPHRGKGGTVIAGMLQAAGDIILFTDMDQATPIDQLNGILPKFNQGYSIVIGSRAGRAGAPIVRKLMAYGFSILRYLILRLPYRDTQCGFKAFKNNAAKEIFRRMKIYNDKVVVKGAAVNAAFDLEVLYIARKLGLKVAEVPVVWKYRKTERINPIKDSLDGLGGMLKVRWNALGGKYNV